MLQKEKKALEKLINTEIHVGFISDVKNKNTSVIDYAIYNEYGTSKIPARPFLNTSFEENKAKYTKISEQIYNKALTDKNVDLDKYIAMLGEEVVNDIKLKISSNIPPRNAPSTIRIKTKKYIKSPTANGGGVKTLIDTGIMRSSVTYKVIGG